MPLCDLFGRKITDLRISVTESCNFRCFYCLPFGPRSVPSRSSALTDAEILWLAEIFVAMGVRKIRLTGGEPLLRKEIASLVCGLKAMRDLETVALTTNGSLLRSTAKSLREAGLSYVTVSLDSLRHGQFLDICGRDGLNEVLLGIQAAKEAGLPLKINIVLLRNRTEDEIFDFVELADSLDVAVRFIEHMPFSGTSWSRESCLLVPEIRAILESRHKLIPIPPKSLSETSQNFRIPGRRGSIGFIPSVSASFCDRCSRMRLTADGFLKPCLHDAFEVDIKPALQARDREGLQRNIQEALRGKPTHHPDWLREGWKGENSREMVRIGG